ncbi:transmembrane protein 273-like isoform X2 [Misgurnus anguillicaudatus]|uniref:transmembrane protein 273-like isoform X2 n=1 Tax=Misgurnus anguillicaudatus TaxID=75329 RepID=UPI003CCFC708
MFDPVRYYSAILIFTIDWLVFTCVKGQSSPNNEPEIKYAVIGVGIGIFFSICFLAVKIYIIRRQMLENDALGGRYAAPKLPPQQRDLSPEEREAVRPPPKSKQHKRSNLKVAGASS